MKRVFCAMLALILLLSLAPAVQVQAAEPDIYTLVEQQIKDYAASINQNDAARTAATALLTNAAFRGKDLSMDENNALTATIFNSYMFHDALSRSCANVIERMQQMNMPFLACYGSCNWYTQTAGYGMFVHSKLGGDTKDRLGGDTKDRRSMVTTHTFSTSITQMTKCLS